MCGGKRQRRQARHAGYGARGQGPMGHSNNGVGGITAIIGAIQEMRLAQQPQQRPSADQPRTAEFDGQEKGVVVDEKKLEAQRQHDQVNFEELPSYNESTGARSPATPRAVPVYVPVYATEAEEMSHPIGPGVSQMPRSNSEMLLDQIAHFRDGLQQYKSGAHEGKWAAKRAAKQFIRDLKDQEMAKRRDVKGYLECGERKRIKRDLRPVKTMLKEAVWEVKRQRKEVY